MKSQLGRVARIVQRTIVLCLGGFLPEPLARRTTLLCAAISAMLLTAYSSNTLAMAVGLLLLYAIWLSEQILALTSTPTSLARHSTISAPYMFFLALGAGSLYAEHSNYLTWMVWLSLFLLGLSTWLSGSISVFLKTTPLVATNFTHNPEIKKLPIVQVKGLLRLTWAIFAVIATLVALSLAVAPWLALIFATGTFVIAIWNTLVAWRYAEFARWRTLRELRNMNPKIVIPYGGTATYQAEMWYPYIDQLNMPYFIVSLSEGTMKRMARNTSRPIVVPDELSSSAVQSLIPNSTRIAYYPHNSAKNSLFRSDRRYKHVFVHHGDGDKAPSFNPNSAKYDILFVAGEGAIDRYKKHGVEIPRSKFKIIGRPPAESIEVDKTPISEKSRPVVLYAPTWRGKNEKENYSSLPYGYEIVTALIERDADVVFRPHPATRSSKEYAQMIDDIQSLLKRDSEQSTRKHIWGDEPESVWSVSDVTNASDAMVADVSGIVTDYLQSGKPYAMATLRFSSDQFKTDFPTSHSAYVITNEPGSLDKALDEMLEKDPLAEMRWERRNYYLGGFNGREAVEMFLDESRKIISA